MWRKNKNWFNKEKAEITNLHSNECLEKIFEQITIMPSLNEEITKREQILEC